MTPPVRVEGASLAYRMSRSHTGTFKEFAIQLVKRQVKYEQFWALRDVSFSVEKGEVFGVVGRNGAGKSTLMKVIARVLPPTEGRVRVLGSVSPMIELGAGFNPELTGIENTIMYGTLLGRGAQTMRDRVGAIAEWAELTDFMDVPIRSYSSGMLARLGFAIATDVEPDVLVVDEVLSVGDEAFRRKSKARMSQMITEGAAVVLVSHDLATVVEVADRVMWIDAGRVIMLGEPKEVVDAYRATVIDAESE